MTDNKAIDLADSIYGLLAPIAGKSTLSEAEVRAAGIPAKWANAVHRQTYLFEEGDDVAAYAKDLAAEIDAELTRLNMMTTTEILAGIPRL